MPNTQQIKSAGKFFLLLIAIFAIILIASLFLPKNIFEDTTAKASNFFYSLFGIKGTIEKKDNTVSIQIEKGPKIIFSELCTGFLETALLAAAIAATFEIKKRKRFFGIIVSIITIFFLNQLRIVATTIAILGTTIQIAEFAHNILFRIFLFIAIACLYAGWYYWATKKN
jgi:exosortase/archaeosortase family protein